MVATQASLPIIFICFSFSFYSVGVIVNRAVLVLF
jgi:hypothetical protein